MNYEPALFRDVGGIEHAKRIILTPNSQRSTDERWRDETRWLVDRISAFMPLRGATCLDYGCGIGRLAKPLIEERGWSIMGVDISQAMRDMAVDYVGSNKFLACAPGALDSLLQFGIHFDFALATWTLQHCESPALEVERIRKTVKVGGRVFLLNTIGRCVPVRENEKFGWYNDGIDILDLLLKSSFVAFRVEEAPKWLIPDPPSIWGIFERVKDQNGGSNQTLL